MTLPAPPPDVAAVLQSLPAPARASIMALRGLVLRTAMSTDTAPIEETLKWGQPAYRPARPRTGTTLRLGWSAAAGPSLYVPCQTDLVDRYRALFPDAFAYVGNREVRVTDAGEPALTPLISMALTYHRDKRP